MSVRAQTTSKTESFFDFIMRLHEQSDELNTLRHILLTQLPVELRDAFDLAAGVWMTYRWVSNITEEEGEFLGSLSNTIWRLWDQYSNVHPEASTMVFPPDKRFFDVHHFSCY